MVNWIRKTPTAVLVSAIVAGVVLTLGFLAGFVYLTVKGEDTTEYRGLVNLAMNAVTVLLGAIAAVGASSAARSASNAEEQTNGQLTTRDETIADLERQVQAYRDAAIRRQGGR